MEAVVELLRGALRPLFVWGAGIRPYRDSSLALARSLGVPVACTWGAIDLMNHYDPLMSGAFGTHGTRAANLAVQNAELLVCIGARLDTKATGTPSDFAPKAKIVMVDIDQAEIDKMPKVGRPIDIGLCMDAGEFISELSSLTLAISAHDLNSSTWNYRAWEAWRNQIIGWKEQYKPEGPAYDLMQQISTHTKPDDIIVSDTGNTLGWIMQGFPFKGERFIHAFNFTPMGYGLGAAVGASFASGHRIIAIVGDGGALVSINELATIARNDLNIKIILLNNEGHSMCRFTQRQWLGGKYYATSLEGGLGFPEWVPLAESFGIESKDFFHPAWLFDGNRPKFVEVDIDPNESLAFQVRFGEALA